MLENAHALSTRILCVFAGGLAKTLSEPSHSSLPCRHSNRYSETVNFTRSCCDAKTRTDVYVSRLATLS